MKRSGAKRLLQEAYTSVSRAALEVEIAINRLQKVFDITMDREYLSYADKLRPIMKELEKIKDDIDYELQIL